MEALMRHRLATAASVVLCALVLLLLLANHQHSAVLPGPTAPARDEHGRLYARMAGAGQLGNMQRYASSSSTVLTCCVCPTC